MQPLQCATSAHMMWICLNLSGGYCSSVAASLRFGHLLMTGCVSICSVPCDHGNTSTSMCTGAVGAGILMSITVDGLSQSHLHICRFMFRMYWRSCLPFAARTRPCVLQDACVSSKERGGILQCKQVNTLI